jgi:hypothetical protein
MKLTVTAALAALMGGVSASMDYGGHQHAHELFHLAKRGEASQNESSTCVPGCTTYYYTSTGPAGRKRLI